MNYTQAESQIRARVRDFAWWLSSNVDRQAHPKPADDAPLEDKASFLRATLPIIARAAREDWEPGGGKRVELDEAFSVLGLAPLEGGK